MIIIIIINNNKRYHGYRGLGCVSVHSVGLIQARYASGNNVRDVFIVAQCQDLFSTGLVTTLSPRGLHEIQQGPFVVSSVSSVATVLFSRDLLVRYYASTTLHSSSNL